MRGTPSPLSGTLNEDPKVLPFTTLLLFLSSLCSTTRGAPRRLLTDCGTLVPDATSQTEFRIFLCQQPPCWVNIRVVSLFLSATMLRAVSCRITKWQWLYVCTYGWSSKKTLGTNSETPEDFRLCPRTNSYRQTCKKLASWTQEFCKNNSSVTSGQHASYRFHVWGSLRSLSRKISTLVETHRV